MVSPTPPPPGYVCRLCKCAGHYITHCLQRNVGA
jgi:hypothetical protein